MWHEGQGLARRWPQPPEPDPLPYPREDEGDKRSSKGGEEEEEEDVGQLRATAGPSQPGARAGLGPSGAVRVEKVQNQGL